MAKRGRPKLSIKRASPDINRQRKTVIMNIRFSPRLLEKIDTEAGRLGLMRSELIRFVLGKYFDDREILALRIGSGSKPPEGRAENE